MVDTLLLTDPDSMARPPHLMLFLKRCILNYIVINLDFQDIGDAFAQPLFANLLFLHSFLRQCMRFRKSLYDFMNKTTSQII